MTKITSTALGIGLAVGAGILLSACQMPTLSSQLTKNVPVQPAPSPAASPDAMTNDSLQTTPTQPTPVTNTTVDQDLQSLDTLNKQSNPAVLGANSASDTNLGVSN